MKDEYSNIPIVNIEPFLAGNDRFLVAKEVVKACEKVGFLIISGHGIETRIIQNAFDKSLDFFRMPQVEKDKYHPTTASQQRGYHAFATRGLAYTLGENAPPDLRETYFLGPLNDHRKHFHNLPGAQKAYAPNIFPDASIGLSAALKTLYLSFEKLSEVLLEIFAIGLEQKEDYFANLIKRHFSILSSHHYPPLPVAPKNNQLRTGAHTDFGAMTILAMTKASGGLEVLMPNDEWLPVQPPAGCLVVNLGDMMSRWTNGHWKSTLHRVVNPKDLNDLSSRRQTLGYFMHPDYDAIIKTIPSCIAPGKAPKFTTITAGEHIAEKIRASHEGGPKTI